MELDDDTVQRLYKAGQEFLRPQEKVYFNGSPSTFMNAAELARRERQIAYVVNSRSVRVSFFNDFGRAVIYFYNLGFGEQICNNKVTLAAYGSIEAISGPNNTTIVSIFSDYRYEHWNSYLTDWWVQLRAGIESQGWNFVTDKIIIEQSEVMNQGTAVTPQSNAQEIKLFELLNQNYNLSELKTLCFSLGIEFENLEGTTREDIARELVSYCGRYGRSHDLEAEIKKQRPHLS